MAAAALIGICLAGHDRLAGAATALLAQSPRDAYIASQRAEGEANKPALEAWQRAADVARENPVSVETEQYVETGYLRSGAQPVAFRISAEAGQTLAVQIARPVGEDSRLFAELYLRKQGSWSYQRTLAAGSTHRWQPSADTLLLLQPALDASARYRLALGRGGSLPFPVSGKGIGDIGGVFGDARGGGTRSHHGVDIFAARGTPVTAVIAGRVRTGESRRGGKVVWLRASLLGESYYYAHLDAIAVNSGQRVEAGTVLGSVGNTGNAQVTPPHLHFGIYQAGTGPVDPLPYLRPRAQTPPTTTAWPSLGQPLQVTASRLNLRVAPNLNAAIITSLPQATQAQATAASGDWYRLRLADGRHGYAAARWLEPVDESELMQSATQQAP